MKGSLIFLPLIFIICVAGQEGKNFKNQSKWTLAMKTVRSEMKECLKLESSNDKKHPPHFCLRKIFLQLFDKVISKDVIRLWKGVKLVRAETTTSKLLSAREDEKAVAEATKRNYNSNRYETLSEATEGRTKTNPAHRNNTLWEHVANGINDMVHTHLLQIDIKELSAGLSAKIIGVETPRHRRRHNMMIAMVFGMTVLGSILVPMGFQFLSVVAGKALLLAKMALLLASINGLKKVASSGVHYGLYQVPDHLSYGYDRGDSKLEYAI